MAVSGRNEFRSNRREQSTGTALSVKHEDSQCRFVGDDNGSVCLRSIGTIELSNRRRWVYVRSGDKIVTPGTSTTTRIPLCRQGRRQTPTF